MTVRVINGDCRSILPTLDADSFDCIVSSPPYWGLRDYGTATWEGGDDPDCAHSVGGQVQDSKAPGAITTGVRPGVDASRCRKCGARRIDQQIGLEPTLDAYVEAMVDVGRELKRVLKPEGTFWLNLGDSYATQGGRGEARMVELGSPSPGAKTVARARGSSSGTKLPSGLKAKDLCGVPWRVAFALQADGWWLRSAIVWAKPNPMPESVTDRPTSAYEMVFLLTKSERYLYDADAIREDPSGRTDAITSFGKPGSIHDKGQTFSLNGLKGANRKNVWTIATQPFKGSHFATMPPDLAERCIKAGSSEKGCCPHCGKAWERVVERECRPNAPSCNGKYDGIGKHRTVSGGVSNDSIERVDRGWSPSCDCPPHEPIPARILDPFGGAGTTGLVADRLGRNATLIELNPAYRDMGENRVRDDAPLFWQAAE